MNKEETVKVFVYGTLKQGFINHERFLNDCKKIRDSFIFGQMFSVNGRFPAVIESVSTDPAVAHTVRGEIYEVPVSRLPKLDWLEGHPDLYRREKRKSFHGEEVEIYLYQQEIEPSFKVIKDGIWR